MKIIHNFLQINTIKKIILNFFLLSSVLAFAVSISAQTVVEEDDPLSERRLTAEVVILDMHNNIVLVRLLTAHRYLMETEAVMNDPSTTERQRNNLRIARAQKIENRDFFNSMMMEGFLTEFNFASQVYFFYDTSSTAIRSGELYGHVFNAEGEIIEIEPLPHKLQPYYLILGVHQPTNGIAVHDSNFNPIHRPFPGFVSAWHEKPGFLKKAFEILYSGRFNAVPKLNRNLWRYYQNTMNP